MPDSDPQLLKSKFTPDFHLHRIGWEDRDDVSVQVLFDRLSDKDNGIWCEATVRAINGDRQQTIQTPTRVNLLNTSRNYGWTGIPDTIKPYLDVDWYEVIKACVGASIETYRAGESPTILTPQAIDHGNGYQPFFIKPFIVTSGVTVLYAEGGLGKSLIGLGAGLSVASGAPIFGQPPAVRGPVIYCDYEDEPDIHQHRLDALMRGHGIDKLDFNIYHKALVAKVSSAQMELRRFITETEAVMAIVDSVGMARGGDANAADDTIRLFRALRSLRIPVLAIDHISSSDLKASRETGDTVVKPYGSVYTPNSSRMLWAGRRLPSSNKERTILELSNTKFNHVPQQDALMVEIVWGDTDIKLNVRDSMWQEFDLSAWDLIESELQVATGWLTAAELSQRTKISKETVLKVLSRHDDELTTKAGGGRGNEKFVQLAPKVDKLDTNMDTER